MEKTAMMEAIERIKAERNKIQKRPEYSEQDDAYDSGLIKSINILNSLLPKEREQIEQASNDASRDGDQFGHIYFTQTYGETK